MTLFGGIVEVQGGRVAILARESETVDSLDLDGIRADRQMAEKALCEAQCERDLETAQVALDRSLIRHEAMNLAALFGEVQPPRCAKCGCANCRCC